jgi:hypothetical protein
MTSVLSGDTQKDRRPSVSGPRVAAPVRGTGARAAPGDLSRIGYVRRAPGALATVLVSVATEPRMQSDGGGKRQGPLPYPE